MRYISTEFDDRPWDDARATEWLPVTMYVGGIEHNAASGRNYLSVYRANLP